MLSKETTETRQEIPAFPLATVIPKHGLQMQPQFFFSQGMTLRDYFAAQVLTSDPYLPEADNHTLELYVKRCYRIADLMIKQREV